MSHKLTKEVKKRLAEYGAKITTPGYVPGQPVQLTAEQLAGVQVDKQGKPIEAGRGYYIAPAPAINHTRRLQDAYGRGGWPAVEVYLQPFMTPEYAAKQLAARAAAGAAAPGAAEVATDAGASPALVAEFFSAGQEGPISPEAERLLAQSAAAVDAHLQAWVPEVQVLPGQLSESAVHFEPLPLTSADEVQTELRTCEPLATGAPAEQAWLDEAGPVLMGLDLATTPARVGIIATGAAWGERYLGQLYEAGHPGPLPEQLLQDCGPCRGQCGICEK